MLLGARTRSAKSLLHTLAAQISLRWRKINHTAQQREQQPSVRTARKRKWHRIERGNGLPLASLSANLRPQMRTSSSVNASEDWKNGCVRHWKNPHSTRADAKVHDTYRGCRLVVGTDLQNTPLTNHRISAAGVHDRSGQDSWNKPRHSNCRDARRYRTKPQRQLKQQVLHRKFRSESCQIWLPDPLAWANSPRHSTSLVCPALANPPRRQGSSHWRRPPWRTLHGHVPSLRGQGLDNCQHRIVRHAAIRAQQPRA